MSSNDSTLEDHSASPARSVWTPTLRVVFSGRQIVAEGAQVLPPGETWIGRSVTAPGVIIDDPHASRQHLRVRVDVRTRTATLTNESRRGTTVDGVAVSEQAALNDGAVIAAGRTLMVFRWEPRPLGDDVPIAGLLGDALSIRRIRALLPSAGPTDAVITLQGETGTGKEVVARAIHVASGRAGAFVAVNCATIPEALAEGQLFGHIAGAFTGAEKPVDGFFRAASDGTLFLDEIAELSAPLQAKLLRALESGSITPLGTFREVRHRARVITATHRDLIEAVRDGRFRNDLYARISDFVISLPPLRARREDVLMLFADAWKTPLPAMDFALARALLLHPWPFNVREVVRLAGQLKIRAGASTRRLELDMIEETLARSGALASPAARPAPVSPRTESAQEEPVSAPNAKPPGRDELLQLLKQHHGVVSEVARAVGRSRKQVYRWMDAHGLDRDALRDGEEAPPGDLENARSETPTVRRGRI